MRWCSASSAAASSSAEVLLWFAGLAFVLVWKVFNDPAIDYRLVVVGALVPDLVDGVVGGAGPLHSLTASAGLLALVMVATRGRRSARRRLLALPIGTFMHLVLDGAWTRTRVFWWPVLGGSFGGARLPSLTRPLLVVAVQEAVGAVALLWAWRRFGLAQPERRRQFLASGRLSA